MLDAIASYIGACLTKISQYTLGDTEQAGDGGKVKIENSIAVLEPIRNSTIKVSINDLLWLFQLTLHDGIKFVAGKMIPVTTSIEIV